MKVEVEVVSTDTIKPSSPTPHHLRNYQLSFLDQISPPIFMPLFFFFEADHGDQNNFTNTAMSNQLKKSLSETLTQFYPLAGRVMDNLHIDCNDAGVPYFEARANCWLSEVVEDPIPGELNKFLPYELDDIRDLPMVIQVTFFDCGGLVLSVGFSHKVADALSFLMFVKSWAGTARGDRHRPCPCFGSSTIFPQKNLTGFKPTTGIVKEKIVTKRFVFTAANIATLRDNYTDKNGAGEYSRRPTRIEALSAFIWSRFVAATQAKGDSDKIYTVLHAVNLRTRIDPPLPEYYFGNISRVAIAVASMDSEEEYCNGIVRRMREAISKIDGAYVKELQENDKHLSFIKERAESFKKGDVVSFSFTSLCNFPLYESDFGWGKPVWVGSASLTFKNLVVFMDTQSGDGIEVWVNLKEEDMAKFEVDKEFLAFVSPTTNAKTQTSGF